MNIQNLVCVYKVCTLTRRSASGICHAGSKVFSGKTLSIKH